MKRNYLLMVSLVYILLVAPLLAQIDLTNENTYQAFGLLGDYTGGDTNIALDVSLKKGFFQILDSDLSMKFLSAIFGEIATSTGNQLVSGNRTIMSGLFALLNLGILGIAGIMIAYGVVLSTLQNAGEVGGAQKVQPIFAVFRVILGTSLLVPISSNGYSAMQVIVMYFVTSGIGMANTIWAETVLYVNARTSGGGLISSIGTVSLSEGTISKTIGNTEITASVTRGSLDQGYTPSKDIKSMLLGQIAGFTEVVEAGINSGSSGPSGPTPKTYDAVDSLYINASGYHIYVSDGNAGINTAISQSLAYGIINAASNIAMMKAKVVSTEVDRLKTYRVTCQINDSCSNQDIEGITNASVNDSYKSTMYGAAAALNGVTLIGRYQDSSTANDPIDANTAISDGWLGAARYYQSFLGYSCDDTIFECIKSYKTKYMAGNTASYSDLSSYLKERMSTEYAEVEMKRYRGASCTLDSSTNIDLIEEEVEKCVGGQILDGISSASANLQNTNFCLYNPSHTECSDQATVSQESLEAAIQSPVFAGLNKLKHFYYGKANENEAPKCTKENQDLVIGPSYTGSNAGKACFDQPRRWTVRMLNVFLSFFLGFNYYDGMGKLEKLNTSKEWWGGTSDYYRPSARGMGVITKWSDLDSDRVLFGVGVYGGGYASSQGATVNPLYASQAIGVGMMNIAADYWVTTTDWIVQYTIWLTTQYVALQSSLAIVFTAIAAFAIYKNAIAWAAVASFAFQIMASIFQTLLQITNFVVSVYMPLGASLAAVLFGIGAIIGIYVPLIPYMVYLFAGIGWVVSVLEAMVAAPLVALGMTHPEGHDLMGKGEQALMLLISVFLRPTMLVFGLLFGTMLLSISYELLNDVFAHSINDFLPGDIIDPTFETNDDDVTSVSSIDTSAKPKGFSILIVLMGAGLVYCYLMWCIVEMSFASVYSIADKIMRWLGQSPESSMVERMMSEVKGQFTQAASQSTSGATQTASKGVQAGAGHFFPGDAKDLAGKKGGGSGKSTASGSAGSGGKQ